MHSLSTIGDNNIVSEDYDIKEKKEMNIKWDVDNKLEINNTIQQHRINNLITENEQEDVTLFYVYLFAFAFKKKIKLNRVEKSSHN